MITIKSTTKKGQMWINAHKMSQCETIHEAYVRPSGAKCAAWQSCVRKCHSEHGRNIRVTGAGTFKFSVAWQTDKGLRVETASNSFLVV